jgi:riboflavin kinase/FMN adenylyltransferase
MNLKRMELVRGSLNVHEPLRGGVVTLGSFDGVHLGHQALVHATVSLAQRLGVPAVMLSFEPLPREYLQAEAPPARLTNLRERWRLLQGIGLDALVLLRFNEALRQMSGAEFLQLLTERLAVRAVVVGHDFRFGKGGQAHAEFLQSAGQREGFAVQVIEPVQAEGVRVSSSAVRAALSAGDFDRAEQLLGRRYSMRGRVVAGEQLGRKLGFPTANLRLRRRVSPLGGIYAVRVHGVANRIWPAVASLGTRPTVGGVEPLLEVFLLDYAGDLYGCELEVEFVAHLRDELRFESVELMVAQMHRDVAVARERLDGTWQ